MSINLFFVVTRETLYDGDGNPYEGYTLGSKEVPISAGFVLGSHNGKDLFHYVTSNKTIAEVAKTLPEYIGDSYIEIMLKSLLGILPELIAKKCINIKYDSGEVDGQGQPIYKIASVEQWELDGAPEIIKVLKPHRFFGVDVD